MERGGMEGRRGGGTERERERERERDRERERERERETERDGETERRRDGERDGETGRETERGESVANLDGILDCTPRKIQSVENPRCSLMRAFMQSSMTARRIIQVE